MWSSWYLRDGPLSLGLADLWSRWRFRETSEPLDSSNWILTGKLRIKSMDYIGLLSDYGFWSNFCLIIEMILDRCWEFKASRVKHLLKSKNRSTILQSTTMGFCNCSSALGRLGYLVDSDMVFQDQQGWPKPTWAKSLGWKGIMN